MERIAKIYVAIVIVAVVLCAMGCGTVKTEQSTIDLLYQTSAKVSATHGFGMAVYLGDGLFLTAKHVVYKDSAEVPFIITFRGGIYPGTILLTEDDTALIRTIVTFPGKVILGAMPKLGSTVFFVQPMILGGRQYNMLQKGMVSMDIGLGFAITTPIYPGASGGGVFQDGALVGIVIGSIPFRYELIGGAALATDKLKETLQSVRVKRLATEKLTVEEP